MNYKTLEDRNLNDGMNMLHHVLVLSPCVGNALYAMIWRYAAIWPEMLSYYSHTNTIFWSGDTHYTVTWLIQSLTSQNLGVAMSYLICYSCSRHSANPAQLLKRQVAVWRVVSSGVTSHALSGDRGMNHALPGRAKLSTDQRNCHRNSLTQNDGEWDFTIYKIFFIFF